MEVPSPHLSEKTQNSPNNSKSLRKLHLYGRILRKNPGLKQANTSMSVPPLASYEWAKKHKRNRKTTEKQARSNPFCPILGSCPTLGTIASGNCLWDWAPFQLHKYDKITAKLRKYDIRGMSHFRTSVPFWEQESPSYWRRRSGNTSENSCLTHTHYSNVIRCVPLYVSR